MKKRISKLDELVSAARAESPVVSFEESARRIVALEQNRRSAGVWAFLGKAFAFPRNAARNLAQTAASSLAQSFGGDGARAVSLGAFSFGALSSSALSSGRLRAAAFAVVALAAAFPALIHDARLGAPFARIQPSPSADPSGEQALVAKATPVQASAKIQAQTKIRAQAEVKTKGGEEYKAEYKKAEYKTLQNSAVAAHTDLRLNAETDSFSAQGSLSAQDSLFVQNTAAQQRSALGKEARNLESDGKEAAERLERFFSRAPELSHQSQDAENFWSRLSVEARISARADVRPNALEQGALSPLQNLSFAALYAVSERHAFGVEGGNEPFALASFTTVATGEEPTFGTSSLTMQGTTQTTEPRQGERRFERTLANRAWAGASYQYSAEALDILGGVQPCARLTLGGGELGGVGRALVGARFLPKERFSFLLAGEGAAVVSSLEGAWEFTPRLGVTFGVSVKF